MFQIEDDMTIHITRGDTAYFTVTAENDGEKYIFQPDDILRMKVFAKKDASNVAFQKTFLVSEEAEKVDILLTEAETKIGDVISKPVDYWYEIELNPYTNPQTIIGYDEDGPKILKLYPEGRDFPSVDAKDIPVIDSELDLTSERPVQNQAIARALIGYDGRVSEAMKKITDTAENIETELETFASEIVTETKEDISKETDLAVQRIQEATSDAEANAKRAEEAADRAETIVGADFADILNGTVPVGDSKKLNGLEASEFVQTLGNAGIRFRMGYGDHNYLSTIDSSIAPVPAVANYAHIFGTNSDGVIVSALSIGIDYTTNIYEYSSTSRNWEQVAKSAECLPKAGGTIDTYLCITGGYGVLSGDAAHTQIQSRVSITAEQGRRGFLVCNTNASPTVEDALRLRDIKPDGTEKDYAVLHTGNSAKVVVSSEGLTAEGSIRVW